MFGHTFFNNSIRNFVITFGSLFNEIYINRTDQSNNNLQTMLVPISYGPRELFLARALGDPKLNRPAMVLPRMSFEINSVTYDPDRKLNTLGRQYQQNIKSPLNADYIYNPVPYNFQISLYVMVKNAEDGTRIVEQILPFFTPDYTPTINIIPEMGIQAEVPIILNSINCVDTYDQAFTERRAIIWTLNFTLKGVLYGPVKTSSGGIIKEINVNFFVPSTNTAQEGVGLNIPGKEGFIITPGVDANGNPTTNTAITINYADVPIGSQFSFITDFFSDN